MGNNSGSQGGVMRDSDTTGGTFKRRIDTYMSESFGGYRTGGTGVYANYVEPSIHAVEHGIRGSLNPSHRSAEYARAKDELRSIGNGGLAAMQATKNSGGECYQNGNYTRNK